MTRRQFLAALASAAAAGAIATIVPIALRNGDKKEPVEAILDTYPEKRIASLADLRRDTPLGFEYPNKGQMNFVVRLGAPARGGIGPERDIVAFNYLCTHMGCPLQGQYKKEHKVLGPCPCHFTTFDLRKNGFVTIGQATQSLPQITLKLDGDDILATGVLGLLYGQAENLA